MSLPETPTEEEQSQEMLWVAKETARFLVEALEQAEFYLLSHFKDKNERVQEWLGQAKMYQKQLDSFFDQIEN